MKRAPHTGESACRTPGWATTWRAPSPAIATKKMRMTGPNIHPTAPVPNRWAANRPIRITSEIGTTRWPRLGETTFRPATAEVTDSAGVIMPSPKNSPAPKIPSTMSFALWGTLRRLTSAVSAMIPPSPRLWARMMNPAYLIETSIISAQKMSDAIP
jgi:hypothetical protein